MSQENRKPSKSFVQNLLELAALLAQIHLGVCKVDLSGDFLFGFFWDFFRRFFLVFWEFFVVFCFVFLLGYFCLSLVLFFGFV